MSYTSGMLNKRVTVIHPKEMNGVTGVATGFQRGETVWAGVTWAKGVRALQQGEVEAYDTLMVRTRWRPDLNRFCRFLIEGRYYVISSFNADRQANTIQATAVEVGKFEIDDKNTPQWLEP